MGGAKGECQSRQEQSVRSLYVEVATVDIFVQFAIAIPVATKCGWRRRSARRRADRPFQKAYSLGGCDARAPRRPGCSLIHPILHPLYLNATMSLQAAIEERRADHSSKPISYTKLAEKYGVDRTTLARREQGKSTSQEDQAINQRLLTLHQEAGLVKYIEGLTVRHLPPTRSMIKGFASEIAWKPASDSWVTDFLHRHQDHLISQWVTAMDSNRHKADSYEKYDRYFSLMHKKIEQYSIEPAHTYNMDEKGFAVGRLSKSKRVFDRPSYEQKRTRQSLQDGNREWITLLATICGDGSFLPPGIIYQADSTNIQSTWIDEMDAAKHSVYLTVSSSGWTNDDVALSWLEQVFDRHTKEKAGRSYRLLIVDGHGSHLSMR